MVLFLVEVLHQYRDGRVGHWGQARPKTSNGNFESDASTFFTWVARMLNSHNSQVQMLRTHATRGRRRRCRAAGCQPAAAVLSLARSGPGQQDATATVAASITPRAEGRGKWIAGAPDGRQQRHTPGVAAFSKSQGAGQFVLKAHWQTEELPSSLVGTCRAEETSSVF